MENCEIGQILFIELNKESYVGTVKSLNKYHIELSNVYDFEKKEKLNGSQLFFKSDIRSIKFVQNDKTEMKTEKCNSGNIDSEIDYSEITLEEIKEIESCVENASYIFQTDCTYHNAIENLKRQDSIALSVESCEMGRHTNTDIITIGTKTNVYIFDIKFLGKVPKDLQYILESEKPRKILHDGRKIADNLQFKQNVHISSIFDTLVAHVATGGDKHITKLNECALNYLKIPQEMFHYSKDINWHHRPLDADRKAIAAKNVIFTYKLYEVLLHKYILRDFYKICSKFAETYRCNSNYIEVVSDMASINQNSVNNITDIDLSHSVDRTLLEDLPE